MTFDAILAQVLDLLQHQGRVAYRALKVRFNLDDNYLEALKDELIYARRLAVDEDSRVLVWTGATVSALPSAPVPAQVQDQAPLSYTPKHLADKILTTRSALEGERKQVTVLFCDIANSTPLAARLGPEAMHTLLNCFFELALDEVHRYEGTINQFLGDGFMALFGAPIAYEDHARRAVLAALGMQRRLTERRADFGLPPGEELAVRLGLQEVGLDHEAGIPYLLHLLGVQAGTEGLAVLSPETIKARTFDTLRQMSLRGSRQRPLLLEVEDLHWIDKTSEDYLMSLVESLVGAPILLLGTYRPGYRPPWVEKSYATQVALRPLASRDSLVVVHSVALLEQLTDHLTQVILAKAEGNPFFLEELTRAVVEQGELQADVAVPDTIQGVLMARIDRLPDAAKRLLQTASALGREFSLRLLGTIWEGPSALEPLLRELKRLEFIYEDTGAEEPIYVFKRVLTQEVTYDSLLQERRRALHARIVEAIETLYADRLADQVEWLARHAFWGEVWAKAAVYYRQAGAKAFARSALREAMVCFEQALVAVEHLPESQERREQAVDLRLDMRNALIALGAFGAIFDHLCEAEKLAVSLDDHRRLG